MGAGQSKNGQPAPTIGQSAPTNRQTAPASKSFISSWFSKSPPAPSAPGSGAPPTVNPQNKTQTPSVTQGINQQNKTLTPSVTQGINQQNKTAPKGTFGGSRKKKMKRVKRNKTNKKYKK